MENLLIPFLMALTIAMFFPIGAALSLKFDIGHRVTSATMSVGAGLLIGASLFDLIPDSIKHLDVYQTVLTVIFAATIFSGVNWALSKYGARHRKRCKDCVSEIEEDETEAGGLSIALGTVLDAFPEALVLGVNLTGKASALPLVIALSLGNVAQSLSSTSGLKSSGLSKTFIYMMWISLAALVILTTLVSYVLLGSMGDTYKPWVEAFAAGVLLSMVCEAMLPEAYEDSPSFSGLLGAVGVCLFLIIKAAF